jgi:hypothetical protein
MSLWLQGPIRTFCDPRALGPPPVCTAAAEVTGHEAVLVARIDPAGVVEPVAVVVVPDDRDAGHQVRRSLRRRLELDHSQRRGAPGADVAVAPRLPRDPLDRVVAVEAAVVAGDRGRRRGEEPPPVGHHERVVGVLQQRIVGQLS